MSTSAKKIVVAVVILLVIAALGGYFMFIPRQEKKYEQAIAAFIADLPGNLAADSIKVHFLGNSAEIRGLRGATKSFEGSDMTVDVATITLTGLNLDLLSGNAAGIVYLADSLILSDGSLNIAMNAGGPDRPIQQNTSFSQWELHNLRGDFAGAVAEFVGDASLERKLDIAATFSAGPTSLKNYVSTITEPALGPLTVSMDSWEAQETSLLSCKDAVWKNMRVTLAALNAEIMSLERISLASMNLPNFLAPLFAALDNDNSDALGAILLGKISKDPIEMRGLVMENFRFQVMSPESVSIRRLSMDLDASTTRLAIKKTVEGLVLPAFVYGSMGIEAAQFSAFYGKPLDLDLRLDVEVTQKSGSLTEVLIRDLSLQDNNLASLQIKADIIHTGKADHLYAVFDDKGDAALQKGELVLVDKNLVGTFLEAELQASAPGGEEEDQPSVAELRETTAQSFIDMYTAQGGFHAVIGEGLGKLIRAPGRLTIRFAPESPVSLSDPLPEALGATVEYTPAE